MLSPFTGRFENRLDQHLTGRRWLNLILAHGKVWDKVIAGDSFQALHLYKFMKEGFEEKWFWLGKHVVAFSNWSLQSPWCYFNSKKLCLLCDSCTLMWEFGEQHFKVIQLLCLAEALVPSSLFSLLTFLHEAENPSLGHMFWSPSCRTSRSLIQLLPLVWKKSPICISQPIPVFPAGKTAHGAMVG